MPIHDWTRVGAATFHDFHCTWVATLKVALNAGMLPTDYYAMSEQHLTRKIADVLTLHASDPTRRQRRTLRRPARGELPGGTGVSPVRTGETPVPPGLFEPAARLTIRHTTGHRMMAMVEILSPGNKAGGSAVIEFVRKAEEALQAGIHLVLIDLLPPGRHDPQGMHGAIMEALSGETYDMPTGNRLTFASYTAETDPVAYLEHPAVGDELPETPLFLTPDYYTTLPLAATYASAYQGTPSFWREVIEGQRSAPE